MPTPASVTGEYDVVVLSSCTVSDPFAGCPAAIEVDTATSVGLTGLPVAGSTAGERNEALTSNMPEVSLTEQLIWI